MKWIVLAASMLALISPAAAQTPGPACGATPGAIQEEGLVEIGGIRQWVTARGTSCANPVVLIVHGGPGNPNTPFADNLFAGWTQEFTVVQWDQRGAGKTYAANPPGEDDPLTMAQLTADGVEVARYAARRFGKRKLIIMGGSWGSALAVNILKADPTLFAAYIGTAQIVRYADNIRGSYDHALALGRAANDADAVTRIEALGPPPWTDPRSFGILRRITRRYEAARTDPLPAGALKPAPGYDTPDYEAAYTAGEDYSYIQFVGFKGNGMAQRIDLAALGTRFPMPIYLIQGAEDLVTIPEISKRYFDSITAPDKAFTLLPRTGHDPNPETLAAQLAMLRRARPFAR